MSKYTFICEGTDLYGKPDGSKITHEVKQETLMDIIESFEHFLRGAGFQFEGFLDIVEPDEPEDYSTKTEQEESMTHTIPQPLASARDNSVTVTYHLKCRRCGLTREQLGESVCYDEQCGLK